MTHDNTCLLKLHGEDYDVKIAVAKLSNIKRDHGNNYEDFLNKIVLDG